jgi:hypothetical protein
MMTHWEEPREGGSMTRARAALYARDGEFESASKEALNTEREMCPWAISKYFGD